MRYLTDLYHRLRRTRDLAQLRRHNALLAGEAAVLRQLLRMAREDLAAANARIDASREAHSADLLVIAELEEELRRGHLLRWPMAREVTWN